MLGFAAWLHEFSAADPALGDLKIFVRDNASTWPYWSQDLAHYVAILSTAPQAERVTLENTLRNYYARWQMEQAPAATSASPIGKLALVVTGIVVVVLLAAGLFFTDFYQSLGHIDQVRGLVTFLFVLITVSIIFVFALAIFWLDSSDEVTKRFAAAKDLLTIVVGIVGTIMGFYFGTSNNDAAKLAVSTLTPPIVRVGEAPTITANINGGAKPYKFAIVFSDPTRKLSDDVLKALNFDGESADGAVSKKIAVPAVTETSTASYVLTATDGKNAKATSNGTLYIAPK